ncbi:MAG: stage 0 sporulation protein [Lachnospiraceae bacterium]|nr:stage 0 sporulation protein [Lachnospiraceae bacterium]
MVTIIGVKFRHQCKCYYFDPRGEELRRGDAVIVETSQGIEYAQVVIPNSEVEEDKIVGELRPILRIADEDDFDQLKLNRKNEADAIKICRKKVADHGLEMKLIRAEYAFDRSKLTFFFTADGRVDFRELVKDLAGIFRTRIELRQVGVRDETKLLGGIGICGRELCCATWLTDFVPVSIKMAKEQNLSLNSAKISGICGRLMCCLKNEEDTYEYLNAQMPAVNSRVRTLDGQSGTVSSVDVLRQRVFVMFSGEKDDEKEVREYPVDELRFTPGRKKDRSKDAEEPEEEQQEQQEMQDNRQKAPKTEDSEGKEYKGDRRPDRDKRPNRKFGEGKDRREQKDPFFKRDRRPDRGRKPERRKDGGNDAS